MREGTVLLRSLDVYLLESIWEPSSENAASGSLSLSDSRELQDNELG